LLRTHDRIKAQNGILVHLITCNLRSFNTETFVQNVLVKIFGKNPLKHRTGEWKKNITDRWACRQTRFSFFLSFFLSSEYGQTSTS